MTPLFLALAVFLAASAPAHEEGAPPQNPPGSAAPVDAVKPLQDIARMLKEAGSEGDGQSIPSERFHHILEGIKALVAPYPNGQRYQAFIDAIHDHFHPHEEHEIPVPSRALGELVVAVGTMATRDQTSDPKKWEELGEKLAKIEGAMKNLSGNLYTAYIEAKNGVLKPSDHPPKPPASGGGGSVGGGGGAPTPPAPLPDLQQGLDQLRSGRPRSALAAADHILANDPSNAEAYSLRAQANYDLKNFPAAASDASVALKLNPADASALTTYNLSQGRGAAPEPSFAPPPVSEAPSAAPVVSARAVPGNDWLGEARRAMDLDPSAAVDAAGRALTADPNSAQALYLRSSAYSRLGQFDRALADAEAGLRLDPKNGLLLDAKARALNGLKRYDEALRAADAALESNPKDAYAYMMRASALGGLGDRAGEIDALRRAAAIDPRFDGALQAALQMPEASDLAFLFPAAGAKAASGAAAAGRVGRFNVLAAASLTGGLLLALGGLPLLLRRGGRKESAVLLEPIRTNGLLGGQYRSLRKIGSGGMGHVYEGTDVALGRRVAIKSMREEIREDPRERERFLKEARLVAALHHPNIVDIFSIIEDGDQAHLIFEYVEGKNLHELIAQKERIPWKEALDYMEGVAAGLDYAHSRQVIHRDLKPSNIMVDAEGRARVMDFGIARMAKDALTRYSMTDTVVGTPPYMAPEQDQGVVRRESDVYSLAVCLYEMVCGKLPFQGSTSGGIALNKANKRFTPPSAVVPGLSKGVDEAFSRAFDPDPDRRFPTAGEFVASLRAA